MARFIHMEDNEDGTVKMTMNLGEVTENEEAEVLFAISFDDIIAGMGIFSPTEEQIEFANENRDKVVAIPKDIEGVDDAD